MLNLKEQRIGERRQMKNGMWATLIDYKIARKCRIRFDNGLEKNCCYKDFYEGTLTDIIIKKSVPSQKKIGLSKKMNCGSTCKIINVFSKNGADYVTVQFNKSGLIKDATYSAFQRGQIADRENNKIEVDQEFENKFGINYKVKEVDRVHKKVVVQFEDGKQKEIDYKFIKNANHPCFDKAGNIFDFHGYSGKCVKIHNTYWHVVDGLGLITVREILDDEANI